MIQRKQIINVLIVTFLLTLGHEVAIATNHMAVAVWFRNVTLVLAIAILVLLIALWLQLKYGILDDEERGDPNPNLFL